MKHGRDVSWDFDSSYNAKKGIKATYVKEWAKKNLNWSSEKNKYFICPQNEQLKRLKYMDCI